ncbi:MAG TPA: hypothetical protein PKJ58_02350, partial [Prolixibacteraceae bacterium]|nr:hypothetical protein [Prolixibacteraceae bacterium]
MQRLSYRGEGLTDSASGKSGGLDGKKKPRRGSCGGRGSVWTTAGHSGPLEGFISGGGSPG